MKPALRMVCYHDVLGSDHVGLRTTATYAATPLRRNRAVVAGRCVVGISYTAKPPSLSGTHLLRTRPMSGELKAR
ncbi:hypothetical protein CFELI_13995 [Corynebacterium felinum]|uniref:Uncharacterized protein n=1 Tax=Corynebacterium felinum TaxID=131318 RepID=A0ABU2B723_9CORY|nr:hypothetical protein [Corynebacterium felinum]WJY96370.1 hypothetical protein CFELI_13995 [Corynebacterium felinum]